MISQYETISVAVAEDLFAVSRDVDYPYQDYDDEQETRLYKGGLAVEGDFASVVDESGFCNTNVIVDGDLVVDGNLEWRNDGFACFLLVTGDVRARNVIMQGNPTVVVRGNVTVKGTVVGFVGNDGGYLAVLGNIQAHAVVILEHFRLHSAHRPQAILAGLPGSFTGVPDYSFNHAVDLAEWEDEEEADGKSSLKDVLTPDLVPGEYENVNGRRVAAAVRSGRPLFRDGVQLK